MNILYFNKEDNGEYAYIGIINDFLTDSTLDFLYNIEDFKGGTTSFGNIPRLQKWYQKDNKYFSSNWKVKYDRWKSHPYCDTLLEFQNNIQSRVNDICDKTNIPKVNINSCLINMYRNGDDIISKHIDNPVSFGEYPTIVLISIGEPRTLHFEKRCDSVEDKSFILESGSILIMGGATQKCYTHCIKKEDTVNKRYSLTFRSFLGV